MLPLVLNFCYRDICYSETFLYVNMFCKLVGAEKKNFVCFFGVY